jgi:gluconate 2-dehydrogenase gamma chain
MPRITRRKFLSNTAALGAAGSLTAGFSLSGCKDDGSSALAPVDSGQSSTLPEFSFTDAQRAALAAAVSRMVPAGGPGDWNGADAGAVEYIEQLLNAFSGSGNPKIYAEGPTRERFAQFRPLSRVKTSGWQAEVLRLREVYSQGLDDLNRLARGPLSLLPGDFSALPELAQDAILTALDLQGTAFFASLYAHTMEGVYSHPVYGGNRDYLGWNSLCYPGDVHGVRFPNGHDPEADDRPWDKFGGYSPEEMIAPGSCGSGIPFAGSQDRAQTLLPDAGIDAVGNILKTLRGPLRR